MKTITKYVAVDGVEFNDEKDCIKYEALIAEVDVIMSMLPELPKDDDCSFANGEGFIQLDGQKFRNCVVSICDIFKRYCDHKWIQQTIDDDSVHLSYVGRLIGDYGIRPLNNAWGRLMCVDNKYREWGQPYYAYNPEKGVNKRLN